MSNFKKQLLAGPYLIWMIGFILLPLVFILYYAITAADGSFTFSNIAAIADPVHVKSILLSLKLGFLCTLFCLVLSYPLCMILSTFRFRHQSFVVFLFILPMWMNFMLRILAWRLLLSNNGIVNAILEAVGTGHVKDVYKRQFQGGLLRHRSLPVLPLPCEFRRMLSHPYHRPRFFSSVRHLPPLPLRWKIRWKSLRNQLPLLLPAHMPSPFPRLSEDRSR